MFELLALIGLIVVGVLVLKLAFCILGAVFHLGFQILLLPFKILGALVLAVLFLPLLILFAPVILILGISFAAVGAAMLGAVCWVFAW